MRAVLVTVAALLLVLTVACAEDSAKPSEHATDTPRATEKGETTRPQLTPLAEAEYADRADRAVAIGKTLSLRYYPEETESFGLDNTEVIEVTAERFELGSPSCGPDDSILSLCDGSVTPVQAVVRVDNPNDVPASIPDVGVLSPDGQELTPYVCPGDQPFSAGHEMLPKTTATITACFGSDAPLDSLSGWLLKVSAVGLVPDQGGEAYWIH